MGFLVVLLWLYSFYRLWMVWAYTLNFDGVSWYLKNENFVYHLLKYLKAKGNLITLNVLKLECRIFQIVHTISTLGFYPVMILV